ncbi:hypothetical protein CXF42_11120, partial [Corynebacterium bovis]
MTTGAGVTPAPHPVPRTVMLPPGSTSDCTSRVAPSVGEVTTTSGGRPGSGAAVVAVGWAVSRAAAGADGVGEGEVDAPTAAGVVGVVGAAEVTGAAGADVRAGAAEVSVAAVAVPAPVTGAVTRPAVTSTARARCGADGAD